MRRRILGSKSAGGGINPSQSKACDICFYDRTSDSLVIAEVDKWNSSTYPSSRYVPIGVVVVPGYHDVYGDGSCGVMSLKPMNCDTPSTGGVSEQGMCWGIHGNNIPGLRDLDQVPVGNTSNGIPTGSSSSYGYLPSDKFGSMRCAHDTDAYYDNFSYSIPSPYLTDGSRNPGYYQTTSPSSLNNALADFDGIGNTAKIITQRGTKDYDSWKPNATAEADYPATSCCDIFHTEGTQQGDWYLPACGELGYIMPPFNKINEAITKMRDAYGSSVGVTLDTSYFYWSSSECDSDYAHDMGTDDGGMYNYGPKDYNFSVRAFLRVK